MRAARDDSGQRKSSLAVVIPATAAACYLTGRLGLALAIPPGCAAVVWPPAGVALAAAAVAGSRVCPTVALSWAGWRSGDAIGAFVLALAIMAVARVPRGERRRTVAPIAAAIAVARSSRRRLSNPARTPKRDERRAS